MGTTIKNGVAITRLNPNTGNSGGDAKLYEEITYSALKTKRDGGTLTPGQLYRITDYHTTTVQENTQSADHQFDIIVTALDESTLSEETSAILHEGDTYFSSANAKLDAWKIWYCFDNDTDRFAWADAENGKGVIYRMIDEWSNDCPYDFKNIQFKRKLTDGAYDPESGTDTWVYTFHGNVYNLDGIIIRSNVDISVYNAALSAYTTDTETEGGMAGCYRNVIKPCGNHSGDDWKWVKGYSLNDNVFFGSWYEGTEDEWGGSMSPHCNYLGDNCYSNTFGDGCYSNTFGNGCYSNTFGDGCYSNTFGNYCYSNTFGYYCDSNTFGNGCDSNTFGNGCCSNTFGNYCYSNTFGNGAAISYCNDIALGDGVQYCEIYGTTTPSVSAPLQNIRVAQGLEGRFNNKIAISVPTNRGYETYVGKNSDGTLVMKCLLDSNS